MIGDGGWQNFPKSDWKFSKFIWLLIIQLSLMTNYETETNQSLSRYQWWKLEIVTKNVNNFSHKLSLTSTHDIHIYDREQWAESSGVLLFSKSILWAKLFKKYTFSALTKQWKRLSKTPRIVQLRRRFFRLCSHKIL